MANIEITNNNTGSVGVLNLQYQDEIITMTAPVTLAAGTLLGRITTGGKMTAYTSGATDGSEVAAMVLQDDLEFTGTGSVDIPCRPIVAGTVNRDKLVAHGVGAITVPESEMLRDYGIVSLTATELTQLDNS